VDLILVRHAQPHRQEVAADVADPGLHPLGVEQARLLAGWLALEHLDGIVQSPARRAVETARPLAAATGIEPTTLDGLSEFDWGLSSYVPMEELKAANDERWQASQRGELWGVGVDPAAFRRRVVDTLEEVVRGHPGMRVVAVCHGGVINAYAGQVLGIERALWFAPACGSISRIAASRRGHRNVVSLNETGHLMSTAPLP
jgi:2,3-bisphosphoglycerate-dependent phosphoglycerate mutase